MEADQNSCFVDNLFDGEKQREIDRYRERQTVRQKGLIKSPTPCNPVPRQKSTTAYTVSSK